jgi:hypothetical protein
VEVEVTWEDQKKINAFGRLNARKHDLSEEQKRKKVEETYFI